ncbi:TetR/AcrR family transcriptional regulator [Spirulina sp. CS-785/01]|uniref:TetR/AcrR family transcriptional regulator n=1 Tax=Spirulina sp. CS-785/01 TaxID=3021716 RepID=UPI00232C154B|nr:TetR/AcrR family transcriptional regulator [Spirulina sp. CS-785/01]MDB9312532.1 TetR/AcrR family transcriptional regulator [Spirulina sp. CS-785/01]
MARPKGQTITQQDILEAAIACLKRDGDVALGVNCVAKELGIRPPSLYNHVANNDDLRRRVAIEGWRQLIATFEELNPHSPDVLRQIAYIYRDFAHENQGLYTIMSTVPLAEDDPDFAPVFQTAMQFYGESLRSHGVTSQTNQLGAMRTLWAMLHGFVELERLGQFKSSLQGTDESFTWAIEAVLKGLQEPEKE